jgi:2-oxoglutarate ferredoxin oxidoreductase subunit gamma
VPVKTEIRFGGSGGQGVVLAAQILGKAAVLDGKNVLQTQAYGAEARGSLAKSEVIISDGKIGFPAVRRCDVLVAMSQGALDALLKDLKETGTLIVDSTNVTTVPETKARVYEVPITETAKKVFAEALYANMVMLGAFSRWRRASGRTFRQERLKPTSTPSRMDFSSNSALLNMDRAEFLCLTMCQAWGLNGQDL